MSTQDFIANSLRCYSQDALFIDRLCDSFPSFDLEDEDVISFDPSSVRNGNALSNHLIRCFYEKIIDHYVEKGLNEDDFEIHINARCSRLTYNNEEIHSEKDLDKFVNEDDHEGGDS